MTCIQPLEIKTSHHPCVANCVGLGILNREIINTLCLCKVSSNILFNFTTGSNFH
ncbi:hypothetical protein IC582_009676 [Cucumis melo]